MEKCVNTHHLAWDWGTFMTVWRLSWEFHTWRRNSERSTSNWDLASLCQSHRTRSYVCLSHTLTRFKKQNPRHSAIDKCRTKTYNTEIYKLTQNTTMDRPCVRYWLSAADKERCRGGGTRHGLYRLSLPQWRHRRSFRYHITEADLWLQYRESTGHETREHHEHSQRGGRDSVPARPCTKNEFLNFTSEFL